MSTALKILESIFTDHEGHQLFVFSADDNDTVGPIPAQLVCETCEDEDSADGSSLLIVGQDELKDLE